MSEVEIPDILKKREKVDSSDILWYLELMMPWLKYLEDINRTLYLILAVLVVIAAKLLFL